MTNKYVLISNRLRAVFCFLLIVIPLLACNGDGECTDCGYIEVTSGDQNADQNADVEWSTSDE